MEKHSFEDVSKVLGYDAETGKIHWTVSRSNRIRPGKEAGTVNAGGYIKIGIDRHYYGAHRIAWLLTFGEWPRAVIDHINGDTQDNRISNLRSVTQAQNSRNQKAAKNNASGFKGVHWHSRLKKWAASIRLDGKLHHLGYFGTPIEAAEAYDRGSVRLHGEFGRSSSNITQRTGVPA